ncbi:Conserved_hypothetical protein [Hexamita inflata]|uniref:Uncharacterized protein n=1 Tax=Hexamita inflata TaxID=28002 RepID=A0AA86TFT6_9EUKA|nr:Conserved hypothetical protein [Hexamita inflata]
MLYLASALLIAVKPSSIYNYTCTSLNDIANFELTHEKPEYYFSVAVESLDGTRWFGSVTDSTGYTKTLPINGRMDLSTMAVGEVKVQLQCTNLGTVNQKISISYTDSRLLLNNEQFTTGSIEETYLMIPVCKENVDIQIKTDALIYASFTNERTDESSAKFNNAQTLTDFVIPKEQIRIPGYLYLHFVKKTATGNIMVYQKSIETIQYNVEYRSSLSSQMHCYDHFITPLHVGDHFVAVSADNDMQNSFSVPAIFFNSEYAPMNLPVVNKNEVQSDLYNGFLDLSPVDYPDAYKKDKSISGVSIGLYTAWLPVTHSESQTYSSYKYSVYFTVNGSYATPGRSTIVNIPAGSDVHDTVLLTKMSDQYAYTNGNRENPNANLIVQIEGNDLATQYQKLMFGYGQPSANQGTLKKISDTVYESLVSFKEASANVPQGELFYSRLYRNTKVAAFQTTLYFEKQYQLIDRVPGMFSKLEDQTDNSFNAFFDPSAGKGVEIQFTHIDSKKMTIHWSQTSFLPMYAGGNKIVCDEGQSCSIKIDAADLDQHLPIYFNFETTSLSFQVVAGPADYLVTELFDSTSATKAKLIMDTDPLKTINKQKYLFDPMYTDATGAVRQDEYIVTTLEMDNTNLKILQRYGVDLVAYIDSVPDPEFHAQRSQQIHIADGIALEIENVVDARKQLVTHIPANQEIFITVACEGQNCGQIAATSIYFSIRVNNVQLITNYDHQREQHVTLRDDQTQKSLFFKQKDEEVSVLRVYHPVNKHGAETEIDCNTVELDIYLCTGTLLSKRQILDIDRMDSCFHHRTVAGPPEQAATNFVEFELDTTKRNIAAGTVYAIIIPDYSLVHGDPKFSSECWAQTRLYKNELISRFHKPVTTTIVSGTSYNTGHHFVVNVPTITGQKGSANTYGDRMVLNFNAHQPVYLCITDIMDEFYPQPSETGAGTCTIYRNLDAATQNEPIIYFDNFMNLRGTGKVQPATRIYMTVWAAAGGNVGEGFDMNITITPQCYINYKEKEMYYFNPKQFNGNDEFVSFAIDFNGVSKTEKLKYAVVSGPECNNQMCRQNVPEEFSMKNIITYVSATSVVPDERSFALRNFDKGVQTLFLYDFLSGETRDFNTIYVTVHYRHSMYINAEGKKSQISYSLYAVKDYTPGKKLAYQKTRAISKNQISSSPLDYYQAQMPYNPSEVILFPCRGKPGLLLDPISPLSTPMDHDYQELVPGLWGKPVVKRFTNNSFTDMNMFITVFDEGLFDYEKNDFSEVASTMEYELFVGSQSEVNTPGNQGQVTVTSFKSKGDGKLRIRFAPAREPNQHADVSQVDYRIYVIPYVGTYDPQTDYSPFTACGVAGQGYSVYVDELGMERVIYDEAAVIKDGYIEVESNLPLWQDNAPAGTVLYVTVLVGGLSYVGVLVGDETLSLASYMGISMAITCTIGAILIVLFWALFVRVKMLQAKGYKPVVA